MLGEIKLMQFPSPYYCDVFLVAVRLMRVQVLHLVEDVVRLLRVLYGSLKRYVDLTDMLVAGFPSGQHYKGAMSAHCHKYKGRT